ncbi:hypothetical protein [Zooshikella ganghwensis]|uniref:hypothetical protein n=1 Tax=Zooshikella ganghwensis TaxID=202772 RepID=UPI0004196551|nr:hypothetical protein [Zooshikella ganghwensis]
MNNEDGMSFESRIKGDITEAIVKSLLVDEGYRVIDSGIEHLIREVLCLSREQYMKLSFANTLRKLPDLVVMNRDQTVSHLVEVKYRQKWSYQLINDLKEQVEFFNQIVLVCVNGSPVTASKEVSGGTHLRAIELKFENRMYLANKFINSKSSEGKEFEWVSVSSQENIDWWSLAPIQFVFKDMTSLSQETSTQKMKLNVNTLLACRAIASLMKTEIWDVSAQSQNLTSD